MSTVVTLASGGIFTPPETDPKLAIRELVEVIQILSLRIEQLEKTLLTIYNVAPEKPREPMIVFADGTNWNPGSGRGFYEWRSGAWFKL
jgi:hypothetical protein